MGRITRTCKRDDPVNLSALDATYFDTMRWNTHVPGMVREADATFARYTSPHKSMRYILGHTIAAEIPSAQLAAFVANETKQAQQDNVEALCWRVHERDAPAALPALLRAQGYVAEAPSTQHFASPRTLSTALATRADSDAIEVREITTPERIADYLPIWQACFGDQDHERYVSDYQKLIESGERGVVFFAAYAVSDDVERAVSSGYMFHTPGTPMALLCGGATLPAFQRHGAYLALVQARVQSAIARGVETLCVDASAESLPILQKLGFIPNDTVTFYEKKFAASL